VPIRQSGSGKSRPRRSVATRPRRSSGSRSGDEHLVGEVRQRERAKKLLFAQEPIDAGLYGFSGRLTGALLSHFHFVLLKHGPKGDPSGRAAVDRLTGFLDFGDPLNTPPRRLAPAREVARLVGKAGAANLPRHDPLVLRLIASPNRPRHCRCFRAVIRTGLCQQLRQKTKTTDPAGAARSVSL